MTSFLLTKYFEKFLKVSFFLFKSKYCSRPEKIAWYDDGFIIPMLSFPIFCYCKSFSLFKIIAIHIEPSYCISCLEYLQFCTFQFIKLLLYTPFCNWVLWSCGSNSSVWLHQLYAGQYSFFLAHGIKEIRYLLILSFCYINWSNKQHQQ